MPKGYTTRNLEVFALHMRAGEEQVDYEAFFRALVRIPSEQRSYEISDKLVALPQVALSKHVVSFIAYEGEPGVNPIIFNTNRGTERFADLRAAEMVAVKTHGLIDLETREAIIEYNQKGAKASDIQQALERAAETLERFALATVELNPVADRTFIEAIEGFDRIKLATLKIARPNIDWTDSRDSLTEVAKDSNARTIAVTVSAGRNNLDREKGLIGFIKLAASQALTMLKAASVTGSRTGEVGDTTISLAKHIEHTKVRVRMTPEGHVDDADIDKNLRAYLATRKQHHRH